MKKPKLITAIDHDLQVLGRDHRRFMRRLKPAFDEIDRALALLDEALSKEEISKRRKLLPPSRSPENAESSD